MNKRIKKIYVIIADNELLFFSTTLRNLHTDFDKANPGLISYITLFRAFAKAPGRLLLNLGGKDYFFQVMDAK
jgi:hypothetical protein